MTQYVTTMCRAFTGLMLAGTFLGCTGTRVAEPVNIILISIDSLRADHVHSYDYPKETTPTLDRLASEGALFENVVAESSWTLPTHVTMFTGVSAQVHGVEYYSGSRLSRDHETLAERLRAAGYRTWGIYSGPYLHPVFGFGRGFDLYEGVIGETIYDDESFDPDSSDPELDRQIKAANFRAHQTVTSPDVTQKAIELLSQAEGRPFFLFLHYFDPHMDYIPQEEIWRRFDPDYQGTLTGVDYQQNPKINRYLPSRELEHIIALYDGEVYFTDQYIGYMIDALDRNGLSDNTLVVVTSDHGDEFFEHGDKGHYRTLFDEVLMVPLIMKLPGRIRPGTRIGEQVRHLDIMPTLLSFAGLSEQGDGVDLRGIVEGRQAPPPLGAVSSLRRGGLWLSYRTPEFKYIVFREEATETEYLYDLTRDRGEQQPVARRTQEVKTNGFDRVLEELKNRLVAEELAARAAKGELDDSAGQELDLPPELLERLRALGYIPSSDEK